MLSTSALCLTTYCSMPAKEIMYVRDKLTKAGFRAA